MEKAPAADTPSTPKQNTAAPSTGVPASSMTLPAVVVSGSGPTSNVLISVVVRPALSLAVASRVQEVIPSGTT